MVAPLIVAGLAAAAPNIINGVMAEVHTVIDRLFPDKEAAAKLKLALDERQNDRDFQERMAQILVNAEEAKNPNWFVSGWRPAVGWIGAFSLGYAAIVDPMIRFVAMVIFKYPGPFPLIDSTLTMQVLFGILGLGAYRTFEKTRK